MEFKFESVFKNYGSKPILNNVSCSINEGVTGILGTNGAGKTTFIKILAGLLKPDKGDFSLNDESVNLESQHWHNLIGYLPQSPGLYIRMTVYEFLDYMLLLSKWGRSSKREKRINEITEELNLTMYVDTPIGQLSGGTKQRAAIAQALIHDPEIIFLDEPTNNLDAEERERFNNYLFKISRSRIILYIGHIVNELTSICKKVILIDGSQIRFYDAPGKMIEAAKPHVKETVISGEDFRKNFAGKKQILSSTLNNEDVVIHYDSRFAGIINGMHVTPTLEESYKIFNNSNFVIS